MLVLLMICGVLLWPGWLVWAVLLLVLGAWRGLEVPQRPALTPRAKLVAAFALVGFLVTVMPRPVEMEWLFYADHPTIPMPEDAAGPQPDAAPESSSPGP